MSDTTVTPVYTEPAVHPERRLSPRSKMAEIVYVNMQAENGGIILDISATGLSFQMASPIAAEREISFRLSAEGIEDVEISGEVVWLDADRKRGGLRFGKLPVKVRTQIQTWLADSEKPAPVELPAEPYDILQQQPPRPARAPRSTVGGASFYPPAKVPAPAPVKDSSNGGSRRSAALDLPVDALPNPLRANSSYRPLPSTEPYFRASQPEKHSSVFLFPLIALLVIASGFLVLNYKREVGVSLIRWGEKISGTNAGQSAGASLPNDAPSSVTSAPGPPEFATVDPSASAPPPSAPAAATPSAAPSDPSAAPRSENADSSADHSKVEAAAAAISAAKPIESKPSSRPAQTPSPEKSRPDVSDNSAREDDGHTELALARQYLRGNAPPRDRDMATHLLWVAVGEGNPQAELELADLYLRSDAVPGKNCAQARILLTDSSNSGNAEALDRLSKLQSYGCR